MTGNPALFTQNFLVLSNEADISHRASLYSMGNYLQEAARSHAHQLGWGVESLRQDQMFWVLSRLEIQVKTYPSPGDIITVETWPKGTDRLFALRDFHVFLGKEIIASATSSWALLQLPARRPAPLTSMSQVMYINQNKHAITHVVDRLPAPGAEVDVFDRKLMYTELDLNGHVNNTRYINWMLDTLPVNYHLNHHVVTARFNYLAEVFPHNSIIIKREQISANSWLFGICDENKRDLFRGLLTFESHE